jgi:hypothetical protein
MKVILKLLFSVITGTLAISRNVGDFMGVLKRWTGNQAGPGSQFRYLIR